jgi:NADP-dependent 3-hydroxy acid dehydrogenase YdfG
MTTGRDLRSQTLFGVKDYVAVVTGAATGMGLMAAQTLANNGARVYLVGRRQDLLQKAADVINSEECNNGKAIAYVSFIVI